MLTQSDPIKRRTLCFICSPPQLFKKLYQMKVFTSLLITLPIDHFIHNIKVTSLQYKIYKLNHIFSFRKSDPGWKPTMLAKQQAIKRWCPIALRYTEVCFLLLSLLPLRKMSAPNHSSKKRERERV